MDCAEATHKKTLEIMRSRSGQNIWKKWRRDLTFGTNFGQSNVQKVLEDVSGPKCAFGMLT